MSVYHKAIIESIEKVDGLGSQMDEALAEGWIMFEDANTDKIMEVDKKESETGIRLSMDEEEAIALALQIDAKTFLTNDREVARIASFLRIPTSGIPPMLLWAVRNRKLSKKKFHEFYKKAIKENFRIESESLLLIYGNILNS